MAGTDPITARIQQSAATHNIGYAGTASATAPVVPSNDQVAKSAGRAEAPQVGAENPGQ